MDAILGIIAIFILGTVLFRVSRASGKFFREDYKKLSPSDKEQIKRDLRADLKEMLIQAIKHPKLF